MTRKFFGVVTILAAVAIAGCGERSAPPVATPAPVAASTQPQANVNVTPPAPATNTTCPVSGEDIDPRDPKLVTLVHQGKTFGFCCDGCIDDFKKDPDKYAPK